MEVAYFAILPASVRYDTTIGYKAKLLYAEITAAISYKNWCYEKLTFWSRLFDVKGSTIVRYIQQLDREGYVIRQVQPGHANRIILPSKVIDKVVEVKVQKPDPDKNKFIRKVMEFWNDKFYDLLSVGIRKTDKLADMVADRLDDFTEDEIMSALQNRHDYVRGSDWHNKKENRHTMTKIELVLGSTDSLLTSLNMKPENDSDDLRAIDTSKDNLNAMK